MVMSIQTFRVNTCFTTNLPKNVIPPPLPPPPLLASPQTNPSPLPNQRRNPNPNPRTPRKKRILEKKRIKRTHHQIQTQRPPSHQHPAKPSPPVAAAATAVPDSRFQCCPAFTDVYSDACRS